MRRLLTSRWIAAHVVVMVVAISFISLGFWQLRRHAETELENTIAQQRYEAAPEPLELLLTGAGPDVDSLEHRRAVATGTFDVTNEVLIRSQVYLGSAGFHVITPLLGDDDVAVLVNRGWVPLVLDSVPVEQAFPQGGEVTVEGWVALTETKGALSPADPETGDLDVMNRVDIPRIGQQTPYPLHPVYLVVTEETEDNGELPVPGDPPVFDDQGPHLAYAIQWFAFAAIGLVGYSFLMRRSATGKT